MKIGNIEIKNPVFLAPMCGVSDIPFCDTVEAFGCGYAVLEMVSAHAITLQKIDSFKKIRRRKSKYPIVAQIFGSDPKIMGESAKIIQNEGVEILDINFGCPVKKVVNGLAGSALMKNPKLLGEIISSVVKATSIPITIKMRKGWDENNQNAAEIAKIAEESGAQMITVHGRTRSQMFNGEADWSFIKKVKDAVNIPVIANGDIVSIETAQKAIEQSNADGIMIARGSYGKPWLLKEISDELYGNDTQIKPNLKEIIQNHLESIIEHYGDHKGLLFIKKHLAWYSSGLSGAKELRKKIYECNDIQNMKSFMKEVTDLIELPN